MIRTIWHLAWCHISCRMLPVPYVYAKPHNAWGPPQIRRSAWLCTCCAQVKVLLGGVSVQSPELALPLGDGDTLSPLPEPVLLLLPSAEAVICRDHLVC
jgi:hypothetical protein